jgi:dimethylargininase
MPIALTRAVPPSIANCELTHLIREAIDVERAAAQHRQYEATLERLGCRVERLPPLPDLPDSVFVEDAAVVFPELAVITRPGAASRHGETASVAEALGRFRPLVAIGAPATLDGGDVLRVGRSVFVGVSSRTNDDGVRQLRDVVEPFGYSVSSIAIGECLHLKSAVTALGESTLLLNRAWVDASRFASFDIVDVDPEEPFAANALPIDGVVVVAAAFPRTRRRLEERGFAVAAVDVSELAKAEGAVTCCSIVIQQARPLS